MTKILTSEMVFEFATRKIMKHLRRLATPHPVEVIWSNIKTHWADTRRYKAKKGYYFQIRLSKNKITTIGELEDTLIHEYAHALSWYPGPDHGAAWGIAFAKAYCWFYGVT